MNQKLLEPLKYYEDEGRATHEKNVNEYFDRLVASSGINAEENRATAKKYYDENAIASKLDKKVKSLKAWRIFLIILSVIGVILLAVSFTQFSISAGRGTILLLIGIGLTVGSLLLIFLRINKRIKGLAEELSAHKAAAQRLLNEAWGQMAPLNGLFDERDTLTLMETTLPEIDFESTFTKEQEELFKKHYDFIDLESQECSMTAALSGKFEGNPFLFCQCYMHEIKNVTYTGSLVISWTETYRDSNGKTRTRRRTQTLTASVVKPKPFYHYNNYLAYGSQAAPKLTFSRAPQVKSNMDDKDIEKKVKKGEKKLKKKAQKALTKGGTFQEMFNSEFDVLFGAENRTDEVEFRLMYTPLAQKNVVDLVTSKTGFGDDFYFTKHKRFNIITSNHSQNWNMATPPSNYYSFDIDVARQKFISFNMGFFKSVFFDFAPLFCVPAYLEEPCKSLETPEAFMSNYPYYEHEAVANAFDKSRFMPDFSIGDGILKTELVEKGEGSDTVAVTANSYTTMEHIDYIPTLGGDGRMHGVPVHWTEYIPVTRTTNISVQGTGMSRKEFDKRKSEEQSLAECVLLHGLIGKIL
ncbi:MAG: hypothetical protein IKC74_03135 [Clostridia bacterium]|nr:hypothetical protein [Clostridia bacterium]